MSIEIPKGHELINEGKEGLEEIVDELEESYQKSLVLNKTDENDLKYLRRYLFTLNTLLLRQIYDIANAVGLEGK